MRTMFRDRIRLRKYFWTQCNNLATSQSMFWNGNPRRDRREIPFLFARPAVRDLPCVRDGVSSLEQGRAPFKMAEWETRTNPLSGTEAGHYYNSAILSWYIPIVNGSALTFNGHPTSHACSKKTQPMGERHVTHQRPRSTNHNGRANNGGKRE